MYLYTITEDPEWNSDFRDKVKPNAILKYRMSDYNKDKQRTLHLFELIGQPLPETPITEIRWT